MPLHDSILIERRFCGPPASANGGYAAGRLAAALGEGIQHSIQVRLHRPPPLDVPLTVNKQATDTAQLANRGELVATAKRTGSDRPPSHPHRSIKPSSQPKPSILTIIPSPIALSADHYASPATGYESSQARFRTPTLSRPFGPPTNISAQAVIRCRASLSGQPSTAPAACRCC